MLKFIWTISAASVLFITLLHLQMCTEGNARNFLMGNSEESAFNSNPKSTEYQSEYHECYITVQEIKRIGGQCVKIRDNFQGCVAGSLMDPFHQNCS